MAASCSNLKRSRTELLASMSSPTRRGKLVSRLKNSMLAGLLSSITRKSFCVRSFTKCSRLSVTVKTTLTSSTRLRMTVSESSPAEPLVAAAPWGAGVLVFTDCEPVLCEDEVWLGGSGEGAVGCGVLAGGGAGGGGGNFEAEGASGSCGCSFWAPNPSGSAAAKTKIT